jgi:hypothetical protein
VKARVQVKLPTFIWGCQIRNEYEVTLGETCSPYVASHWYRPPDGQCRRGDRCTLNYEGRSIERIHLNKDGSKWNKNMSGCHTGTPERRGEGRKRHDATQKKAGFRNNHNTGRITAVNIDTRFCSAANTTTVSVR